MYEQLIPERRSLIPVDAGQAPAAGSRARRNHWDWTVWPAYRSFAGVDCGHNRRSILLQCL